MDKLISVIEKLSNRTLFDYFITIAPVVLSLVAIYISIGSTKKQNKIALLDKRLEIYTDLKKCIATIIVEGRVTTQNVNMFMFKSRDVKFLFDDDMEKLCDEIYNSMLKLQRIGVMVEAGINGSENVRNHADNCDEEALLLEKMLEYSEKIEIAFSPYICIKKSRKCNKRN